MRFAFIFLFLTSSLLYSQNWQYQVNFQISLGNIKTNPESFEITKVPPFNLLGSQYISPFIGTSIMVKRKSNFFISGSTNFGYHPQHQLI